MDPKTEFERLVRTAVDEVGVSLGSSLSELSEYAAGRAAHLSTLTDDPGFTVALKAERDAVVLRAAVMAHRRQQELRQRLLGITHAFLLLVARGVLDAIPSAPEKDAPA